MSVSQVNAQKDTLFFENFETVNFDSMLMQATGKDTRWVNWDKDGKEAGVASIPSYWYEAPEIYQVQVTKPAVMNRTAHSLSWLKGELLGSSNVLISPPIKINDDKATLSWQSCPLQGPAFMDGYKVLITVTSNDISKAKPDTVFVAAEVTSYKDPGTLNLKDFTFSKGYIHADGYTKKEYWDTTKLTTFYRGRLEPHTVSLAKYKGRTIYVHFYHDSSDDYIFELDNVLVRGNKPVNTQNVVAEEMRLLTYPNPTTLFLNVYSEVKDAGKAEISVTNMEGKNVLQLYEGQVSGTINQTFDVGALTAGNYILQIKMGDKIATQKFVKQ